MPGGVIVGDSGLCCCVVGLRSMCDVNCSSAMTTHCLLCLGLILQRTQTEARGSDMLFEGLGVQSGTPAPLGNREQRSARYPSPSGTQTATLSPVPQSHQDTESNAQPGTPAPLGHREQRPAPPGHREQRSGPVCMKPFIRV